jgi:hypothetical protein
LGNICCIPHDSKRISAKEAELDHKKPRIFQVIVTTFVQAHGIEITPEMLSAPQDRWFGDYSGFGMVD